VTPGLARALCWRVAADFAAHCSARGCWRQKLWTTAATRISNVPGTSGTKCARKSASMSNAVERPNEIDHAARTRRAGARLQKEIIPPAA